jgi:hypothetical protein
MAKGLNPGIRFHVANSKDEMISLISELMRQPFTDEMITERMRFLSVNFNNIESANKLINLI